MASQTHRVFEFKTSLGKDELLLRRMSGVEALSQPYQLDFDLLSTKGDVDADKVLGETASLGFKLPNGEKRFFHGYVTELSQGGWTQRFHEYRAVVRPWFWLLTRTADCRIFQEKTVPQIFEDVVKEYGFSDYELRLRGAYEPWEYCVQYRETDFNFLSRLLEQEGIYYFFEHEESKHTMVLADGPSSHKTRKDYETVPYYPSDTPNTERERDHLDSWSYTKRVQPGNFATTDFDFEKPRNSLAATANISRPHAQAAYEMFDYPAELSKLDGGQSSRTASIRIQELQVPYMIAQASGDAAGLAPGLRFKLDKYPRKDLNIDYLITQATYDLSSDAYETGDAEAEEEFFVSIEVTDAKESFRPARQTPKPVVQGAQTAIVVGKTGEEIYTDKYGRVKVQFHWDRYGKSDENSSCWIRVSQAWAGKNWGAIQIPRMGQEVIVSFLEGDPDQPIITGRVYNGDYMPPYGLPANATQSGVKSRSSKGGAEANFNEIRFEDKKGSEQLYIHAEKNQDIVVEASETHSVGANRKKTIGNDETTEVKANRTEKVGADEKITIDGSRTEKVGVNETITIAADRTESVGANESVTVTGNQTITVLGNRTDTVAGSITQAVAGSSTHMVAGSYTMQCASAVTFVALGGYTLLAPAGTKVIDSFLSKLGGDLIETYGKAVKFTPINLEVNAFKSEVHGIKVDFGAVFNKKAGVGLKKLGAQLLNCDSALLQKTGVTLAKAGAFLIG